MTGILFPLPSGGEGWGEGGWLFGHWLLELIWNL